MNDIFPPFATTAAPGTEPKVTIGPASSSGASVEVVERKKRGPRRGTKRAAKEIKAPKKKGRPKKTEEVRASRPAYQMESDFRLSDLVGLQAEDVKPLADAWKVFKALEPERRTRVLGILNKVLA